MVSARSLTVVCALAFACLFGCGKPEAPPPSENDVQEFRSALQDGDAAVVDRLLTAKPALANAPGANGETPLKAAERQNNEELAAVIRRHGGHE
jgi:hypothetical protein